MHILLAQAYGQSTYGSVAYGSGVIQIGPLTLPNTGASWLALGGAALLAVGIGLFIWLRLRSRPQ